MYKALALLLCVAVSIDSRGVKTGSGKAKDPAIPNRFIGDGKIVGGQVATQGQFPYQVALYENYFGTRYFFCGASIISPTVIVSAGHCLDGANAADIIVVAGEQELNRNSGIEQERQAARVIVHSGYDDWDLTNDISLIILDEPLELNENVQAIGLPPQNEEVSGGSCVVSGWGTTREGGSVSQSLRYVSVPYVADAECNDAYDGEIVDSMLCAGVTGKDACQGDSGGPIVCDGSNTLSGVVSWGNGCARAGYPGVYTQTSYFRDWIAQNSGV